MKCKSGYKLKDGKCSPKLPLGINIISIYYYIKSILVLILGVLLLLFGGVLALIPILGLIGAGISIFLAIILVAISIITFFIARGLRRGKNWSRILIIIIMILGIIGAVIGKSSISIISLIIDIIIILYLILDRDVRRYFD